MRKRERERATEREGTREMGRGERRVGVDFEIEGAGKVKFPRDTPHVLGKYMFPYGF